MSEIKNEIKQNVDGSFTITDAHSTADIVRWLLTQDSKETILYLLKEALAQPEQEPTRSQKMRDAGHTRRPKGWDKEQELEPVAWLSKGGKGIWFHEPDASLNAIPLYTTPPQRKPLTDEQIQKCYETTGHYQTLRPQDKFAVFALARAIEAAHGIKE